MQKEEGKILNPIHLFPDKYFVDLHCLKSKIKASLLLNQQTIH